MDNYTITLQFDNGDAIVLNCSGSADILTIFEERKLIEVKLKVISREYIDKEIIQKP